MKLSGGTPHIPLSAATGSFGFLSLARSRDGRDTKIGHEPTTHRTSHTTCDAISTHVARRSADCAGPLPRCMPAHRIPHMHVAVVTNKVGRPCQARLALGPSQRHSYRQSGRASHSRTRSLRQPREFHRLPSILIHPLAMPAHHSVVTPSSPPRPARMPHGERRCLSTSCPLSPFLCRRTASSSSSDHPFPTWPRRPPPRRPCVPPPPRP